MGHCSPLVPFFSRPSNDGVKADVLIKFQIPRKNAGTLKRQADNILQEKLQSSQSILKRDASLPYLRGKTTFFFSQ
jgi:transmembrane serine protease 11G